MKTYDVIIIGGGPIGLACGIAAQRAGLEYLIIEKAALVNSLYHYPVNMTFFSTSERLEIGGVPFVSNNRRPVRREALEYYRRIVTTFILNIHFFEEVKEVARSGKFKKITTTRNTYRAANVIVATGFYGIPVMMNVKGEKLKKVKHYYDDPHFYAFQDVIVVGAANSAIDAALETWRKGARVTLVIRDDKISERVKYWVRPDILNRINEGSIKVYYNSTIKEIREKEVDILTPEGKVTVPNDWVLAMTGYRPDLDFIKKMGVNLSKDGVMRPSYDEKTHESNIKGIYLAGVICGGLNTHKWFIENCREHAKLIIKDIVKKKRTTSPT
ncbi:MAG: YpdA family putative bacillithiol disulfide reductase [Chitinophagaceae bacterium]|nr:YpdA family putative bacillithiol disulfide reductase [Chitinophagaceae bacterium]